MQLEQPKINVQTVDTLFQIHNNRDFKKYFYIYELPVLI